MPIPQSRTYMYASPSIMNVYICLSLNCDRIYMSLTQSRTLRRFMLSWRNDIVGSEYSFLSSLQVIDSGVGWFDVWEGYHGSRRC